MINKPVGAVAKTDIDQLVVNSVKEGRDIEYKLVLPSPTDDGKREFLADISSFANAGGGDLLYGMGAADGIPTDAKGVQIASEDQEELRLTNIIRDGIQPRITGISMQFIRSFSDGSVLLIRVPKSWNPPHMVTFRGTSRFFTRTGAGKHQMDIGEIRSAFSLSEQIPQRIRQFRDERIGRLIAGDSPVGLPKGATMVLHLVPLISFSPEFRVDVTRAVNGSDVFLSPLGSTGFNSRYNFDGLLTYSSDSVRYDDSISTYCQLFRTGQIESVEAEFTNPANQQTPQTIPAIAYEEHAIRSLELYLKALKVLGVTAPIVVLLSMIGVKGTQMGTGPRLRHGSPIDREVLLLPDVLIEEYGQATDKLLKPVFDAVWNACGYPYSFNYKDGNWVSNNI